MHEPNRSGGHTKKVRMWINGAVPQARVHPLANWWRHHVGHTEVDCVVGLRIDNRWQHAMQKVTVLSALGLKPVATLPHRRQLERRPQDWNHKRQRHCVRPHTRSVHEQLTIKFGARCVPTLKLPSFVDSQHRLQIILRCQPPDLRLWENFPHLVGREPGQAMLKGQQQRETQELQEDVELTKRNWLMSQRQTDVSRRQTDVPSPTRDLTKWNWLTSTTSPTHAIKTLHAKFGWVSKPVVCMILMWPKALQRTCS